MNAKCTCTVLKQTYKNLKRDIGRELLKSIRFNKKVFLLFSPLYFPNCLLGSPSRQTVQDLHIRRTLQDMSIGPGGQLCTRMCFILSMVWTHLWASGVYDRSDKLLIFIAMLFYEYFILCKILVLLKAKVPFPYF